MGNESRFSRWLLFADPVQFVWNDFASQCAPHVVLNTMRAKKSQVSSSVHATFASVARTGISCLTCINSPRICQWIISPLRHTLAGESYCFAKPPASIHCRRFEVHVPTECSVFTISQWNSLERLRAGLKLLRRHHVSKPSGALVSLRTFAYQACVPSASRFLLSTCKTITTSAMTCGHHDLVSSWQTIWH